MGGERFTSEMTSLRSTATRSGFRALNRLVAPLVGAGSATRCRSASARCSSRRPVDRAAAPIRAADVDAVRRLGAGVHGAGRSQWMANLEADPSARVRLFGQDHEASSSIAELGGLRVALLPRAAA